MLPYELPDLRRTRTAWVICSVAALGAFALSILLLIITLVVGGDPDNPLSHFLVWVMALGVAGFVVTSFLGGLQVFTFGFEEKPGADKELERIEREAIAKMRHTTEEFLAGVQREATP